MSWLSSAWDRNKGTIAGIGGGALGFALGGPAGAAVGYGIGSSITSNAKKKSPAEQANEAEMADLNKQRQTALAGLKNDAANPYTAPLDNKDIPAINYTAPTGGQRDNSYLDKATAMQRPSGVIANDAAQEMRDLGQFDYKDRAPTNMAGDTLGEIKNFRGDATDLAKQYATQGYSGGPAQPGVTSRDVNNMTERASVDELMSFDPSAAFEKYVTGAQGAFNETLNTANNRLTNTAAGGNRLNSGFFDLDRGELGRQLSADARNAMQQKALDTNQQKLSAITSGSTIRAEDLNSLRQQYLDAQKGNADRALDAGKSNADFANRAADRDATFRTNTLNTLQSADKTNLDALTKAREFMDVDRDRVDDNYNTDRTFETNDFQRWQDTLGKVSTIQRADQARGDDIFSEDRGFNMDVDARKGANFESDRAYDMDAFNTSNDTRFKGQALADSRQTFNQGVHDNATNRYLDLLSGNSDRAQGATNAYMTNATNAANSRNDFLGSLVGAGLGNLSRSGGATGSGTLPPTVNIPGSPPGVQGVTPGATSYEDFRRGRMPLPTFDSSQIQMPAPRRRA